MSNLFGVGHRAREEEAARSSTSHPFAILWPLRPVRFFDSVNSRGFLSRALFLPLSLSLTVGSHVWNEIKERHAVLNWTVLQNSREYLFRLRKELGK